MTDIERVAKSECRRFGGSGLMLAGVIVGGIGLVLVASEALHLSRHWQTVAVGAVLFVAGALRHAVRGGGDG